MSGTHTESSPAIAALLTLALAAWGTGCGDGTQTAKEPDRNDGDTQATEEPDENGDSTQTTEEPDENGGPIADDPFGLVAGEGIFVGMDGIQDFGVLLPLYFSANEEDTDLYETEEGTYELSEESQDKLAAMMSGILGFPAWIIKPYLSAPGKIFRVAGTRAGATEIQTKVTFFDNTPITAPTKETRLAVIKYAPEQITVGETYYQDNNCASCHDGGSSDAPAHTLGRVAFTSDRGIVDLLERGTPFVPGSDVTYQHQYSFDSDYERGGVAGYLRLIQEKDPDVLVKTVVESGDLSVFNLCEGGCR